MTSQNDVMADNNDTWKKKATHNTYGKMVNSSHGYVRTSVTTLCNIAPITTKTGQSCAKRNETPENKTKIQYYPYNS